MDSDLSLNSELTAFNPPDFFGLKDASEVTWAHAVNSRAALEEAIAGVFSFTKIYLFMLVHFVGPYLMLEADVSLQNQG